MKNKKPGDENPFGEDELVSLAKPISDKVYDGWCNASGGAADVGRMKEKSMKNDEPKIIEDPGEEIRLAIVDDNMLMIQIHNFLMVAKGGAIRLNGSKINPDKLREIAKAMGDVLEFHDRYSGVVWIDSFGPDEKITAHPLPPGDIEGER